MKKQILLSATLLIFAASAIAQKMNTDSDLHSLVDAERQFAARSVASGIRDAFLANLAEDAIVFRPYAVNGRKWYGERPPNPGKLTWEPVKAEISRAGDLGYTTGPWEYREKAEDEKAVAFGNYVTVWKRQADGEWKFVIDTGIDNPQPTTTPVLELPKMAAKSAQKPARKVDVEAEKSALLNTDREFSKASGATGAARAYGSYMTSDAILFRPDNFPVKDGRQIQQTLSARPGKLVWHPAFADVARSGDMGYTYGVAEYYESGAQQKPSEYSTYVRIWKKQEGGSWKVVIDVANPAPPPSPKPE